VSLNIVIYISFKPNFSFLFFSKLYREHKRNRKEVSKDVFEKIMTPSEIGNTTTHNHTRHTNIEPQ